MISFFFSHKSIRYVPIIDAGLKYSKVDKYFQIGEKQGAFIKSAVSNQTLVGKVWPGYAVFLSWYHPYAKEIWFEGLKDLYGKIEYDGIWLDMNDLSSFCYGECPPESSPPLESSTNNSHDPTEFDNIPYVPGGDLEANTISMTGFHYSTNAFEDKVLKEYNTHSLWTLYESKITKEFFETQIKKRLFLGKRPFLLTRSSFVGNGMFSAKWLGDNYSNWEFLRYSIIGMFDFQLFGIPMIGADICGFHGYAEEELCARWFQLGAFYPFSRNHNEKGYSDQFPYSFSNLTLVAMKNAFRQKYSLIMYYYTQLYHASLYGGAFIRPLFFEYPEDDYAYNQTEKTFMAGPALLIVPVINQGMTNVSVYLPNSNWYDLNSFLQIPIINNTQNEVTLQGGFEFVNVLIRGGHILPYQNAQTITRINSLKTLPMTLLIAPDKQGSAKGCLIFDDEDSLQPIQNEIYVQIEFEFSMASKSLIVKLLHDYSDPNYEYGKFRNLIILGAKEWENITSACVYLNKEKISIIGKYIRQSAILIFSDIHLNISWKSIQKIEFGSPCS